jgi:hypothetical protein
VMSAATAATSPSPIRTHTVFTSDPLSDSYRLTSGGDAFRTWSSCTNPSAFSEQA